MDAETFKRCGKDMIDYITDYLDNIRERPVKPKVEPGYLKELLPADAPQTGEDFSEIMKDVERFIMPGITHWQSPRFHAYYPAGNSYPSLLADMLSGAIGCVGFSWATSPACTELEMITTDWLGKMLGLPETFLHSGPGKGGGVIQVAASESVFLCLLAARARMIGIIKEQHPEMDDTTINSRLVAYCSDQANSSVPRAAIMAGVHVEKLPHHTDFGMKGKTLRDAIEKDKAVGKIPFFVCATLGTTATCSFDELDAIGPISQENNAWLHIDAAYAGSAFVCPEFRNLLKGIEYAHSFCTNPHKWMLIQFDMCVLWVQNSPELIENFRVDPVYLKQPTEHLVPDFRHWQIPLSRRFRALKLWFTLRTYGVEGVQRYIRQHCKLAHEFAAMVENDGRFELVSDVVMGLVCFRIKSDNDLSEKLFQELMADGRLYMTPARTDIVYFLRFAICAEYITSDDIKDSFKIIKECTDNVINKKLHLKKLVKTISFDVGRKKLDFTALLQNRVKFTSGDSDSSADYLRASH